MEYIIFLERVFSTLDESYLLQILLTRVDVLIDTFILTTLKKTVINQEIDKYIQHASF